MTNSKECMRYLLSLLIPDAYRDKVREEYGFEIEEGATYFDLLQKRWIQLAESGDVEAEKIVKEFGFMNDSQKEKALLNN